MRIPVYLSVALLSVTLCIGWRDHRRLSAARENLAKLIDEANRQGISTPSGHIRNTKRERADSRQTAGALASDWMAYQEELALLAKEGGQVDEVMQERESLLWERANLLDTVGLEAFISRILDDSDVSEAIRRDLTYYAISSLMKKNPQASLDMVRRASALFEGDRRGNSLVDSAIHHLACVNPVVAAEWVQKNSGNPNGFVTDQTKIHLITGTCLKDPGLAFQLLGEMDIEDNQRAIWSLAECSRTPEQKTAVLGALRGHMATLANAGACENIRTQFLRGLANTFAYGNFGEAREWFESTTLTPRELTVCAQQLCSSVIPDETGQWIEWFGRKLPPDEARQQTENMMQTWILNDYQGAGKWLANTADGPIKHTAARTYAEALFPHDRDIAIQWAMSLPAGNDRDSTLRQFYQNWPKDDPAGAAEFAKENGIE